MFKKFVVAIAATLFFLFPVTSLASAVTSTPTTASAATLSLPSNPKVLLLGDSYTQGVGATSYNKGWAYLVGKPLGWNVTIDGRGGSGYCNPTNYGDRKGQFDQRLWNHPANSYDLIVIEGSSNDANARGYSDYDRSVCINKTIRVAQSRYPKAKILLVSATNPYGGVYSEVDAKLKSAASFYKIPLIVPSAEKWFVSGDGSRYANNTEGDSGKGHPNNAGYQHYADRFVADVKAMS